MFEAEYAELASSTLCDRHGLSRKLRELEKQAHAGRSIETALTVLRRDISRSQQSSQTRIDALPRQIEYPQNLPISARVGDIGRLLREHQVLIVAGDTGSGKTTQLPKVCLEAGFGRYGLIGHTQPRRLAAVSVANRIAEELHCEPGSGVGYQVRFNEKVSERTYLKLMTDGILLAEIQSDRFLNNYEVLIIDEAHERSLNIDFLLGFLKQLLPKRKDLKLIITSATIDVQKFSQHFANAPIVSVSGRSYPVAVHYAPLAVEKAETAEESAQLLAILQAIREIELIDKERQRNTGDVLVFLSGERDIRDTANFLRKQHLPDCEILPLYARLRHSEQIRIFQPHRGRRIVLATNVAETSLTVPGINYVIDTGLARISRYSLQSKVQRLPIEPVSQASANQRKGRCGRLADGVCIRLYSEQDFNSRPLFTDPEILRTNLASVILRMKHLRLGDAEDFPFLEAPEQKAINEGARLLAELNALTPARELTEYGRKMATIPVDPKLGRMLIAADSQRCLRELLIIVSALSSQDPREISQDNRQLALQRLAVFNHPDSDFLSLVNLWDAYEQQRQNLTQGQLRKYCKTHFLSFMRMRDWRDLHRQLLLSCQQLGMKCNQDKAEYAPVHRSIITGSLNQIASLDERKIYQGNRSRKFSLFSSSVLAAKPPKWIVTGEQIETSGTFATMAAKIDPLWVEQAALHLVKRDYFEPHWSKSRQEVMAYEKVQLYGLVLVERALVRFAVIDPAACRDIFIREALAAEQIETALPFYLHNRKFLADLAREEDKLRRPELIVSEREIVDFYSARIPDHVISTQQLEQWWRETAAVAPDALLMTRDNLIESSALQDKLAAYPDVAAMQQNRLLIDYVFEPGHARDGATLELPLAVLNQVSQADVDWAVPGLLREKCIALLKGLPKTLRKNFIPVSGFVDEIIDSMQPQDGELIDALVLQARTRKRVDIDPELLRQVSLPNYLQVKISVRDSAGIELALGTDIAQLRANLLQDEQCEATASQTVQNQHETEVTGITDWTIGDLPSEVQMGDDLIVVRYPALVDAGETVSVKLFADKDAARQTHRGGLLRLYMLKSVQQRNLLRKQFIRFVNKHALLVPAEFKNIGEDAVMTSYAAAFSIDQQDVRDAAAFERALQAGKPAIITSGERIEHALQHVFERSFNIRRRLRELTAASLEYLKADIEQQLAALLHADFLLTTDWYWLMEMPRYLEAIEVRLDKAGQSVERDKSQSLLLQDYWQRYLHLSSRSKSRNINELQTLRWMLEELRVSLFAQGLGTRLPVSPQRVDKLFAKIR